MWTITQTVTQTAIKAIRQGSKSSQRLKTQQKAVPEEMQWVMQAPRQVTTFEVAHI